MADLLNKVIQGDCLEVMRDIPDKSVDMILCDLPYGTTACKWDTVIPFEPLWAEYERIIKDNGAIVLTASQPFTTALIASNMKLFKYCWVWDKGSAANFVLAKRQPMKYHEDICVFYKKQSTYNPIMWEGKPNHSRGSTEYGNTRFLTGPIKIVESDKSGKKYPRSIINITKHPSQCKFHPTQKPVALFEYLISTYTNDGDVILDNCIGSGTTAVATINVGGGRQFIGIEREQQYVDIANERIQAAYDAKLTQMEAE